MAVHELPESVAKLVRSSQVITSVWSVVKELVENALDADATVIDVKLERNGIDKIEVRDNGTGISVSDVVNVCLPHYTSKLACYSDLDNLRSYGFRGEALNSLCSVANVSITTRTAEDAFATCYNYDKDGVLVGQSPSHQMKGTIVTATNLFRNLPVRKQYYSSLKKSSEELRRVEKVVKSLSVIHPRLRVTLTHNKCLIWQKTLSYSLKEALFSVYPQNVVKNLEDGFHVFGDISVEMLVPKKGCNISVLCQSSSSDAVMFYVNKRPVKDKKIEKLVLEEISHFYASTIPHNKCSICLISLTVPTEYLDVNLEPNKTRVFIKDHDDVLKCIREAMSLHFYQQSVFNVANEKILSDDEIGSISNRKTKRQKMGPEQQLENDLEHKNDLEIEIIAGNELSTNEEMSSSFSDDQNDVTENSEQNSACIDLDAQDVDTCSDAEVSKFHDRAENSTIAKSTFSCDVSNILPEVSNYIANLDNNKEIVRDLNKISKMFGDTKKVKKEFLKEMKTYQHRNRSKERKILSDTLVSGTQSSTELFDKVEENFTTQNSLLLGELDKEQDNYSNKQKSETGNTQISLTQWSKGNVVIQNKPLEGGTTVLHNRKSILSNFRYADKSKFENEDKPITQSKSPINGSSNKLNDKQLGGFTKFAKEIRSDLIKNAPGISFTQVASELAKRWGNLHDDEKNLYMRKDKAKSQKAQSSQLNSKQLPTRKQFLLQLSFNELKRRIETSRSSRQDKNCENEMRLVTSAPFLETNIWLYKKGSHIGAVDVRNLQEGVLLHENMSSMAAPLFHLEVPVTVRESDIGKEFWNLLLSQEKCESGHNTYTITEQRLVKNGYKIEIRYEDETQCNASPNVCIKEIFLDILGSEIEELVQILRMIPYAKDLGHCRTFQMKHYIMEQTKRTLDKKPIPLDQEEVIQLLQHFKDHIVPDARQFHYNKIVLKTLHIF